MSKNIKPTIGKTITILAAIFTIIVGLIAIYQFVKPSTPTSSQSSSTSQGITAVTQSLSTPSPTPTLQVIPINQTTSCANCSYYTFSLMVKNATIDPGSSQVVLLIELRNTSTHTIDEEFSYLKLQDLQTGLTTSGAGDGFNLTQFTANQFILFRPTFQFVPVAGHEYSLSAGLSALGAAFIPITIKF